MNKTDLSTFNNTWYNPGGSFLKRSLWYFINAHVLKSAMPFMGFKIALLKMFGAKIGKGLVLKPHVSVKYPWHLEIGNHVWIGENVWIDNLDKVKIGDNVCLSQGALLLSGNHNYKKTSFDLIVKPIIIEEGAWIGAKSIVTQGVIIGQHAVLKVNSVATSNLEAYGIYNGNP
ncbi:MAG: colanic acid biosynthesis acetyltransferase WcaF, partial [Bacteroidia bacterium]|nr:colanic acid biosynthesis acetyltransferase WcaF [Bacteroidia bacterium]